MTEDEARYWVETRLSAERVAMIETFATAVMEENARQNLISPASIPHVWARHVVDSLQLLGRGRRGRWLDIGTGGGFPGMILALAGASVHMVEPRRKRATFLAAQVERFGLDDATVSCARVEQVRDVALNITARAVATVEKLLHAAAHCATSETRWLLPRGSVDDADLARLAAQHKLVFHVEQSLTQSGSAILILEGRPQ